MKRQALTALLVGLLAGVLSAGFSVGRPSAVNKQVSRLDDKVRARQLAGAAPNGVPVISAVTAVSTTVAAGGFAAITVSASDPDGDALSYICVSTAGIGSGSGPNRYWLAPSTPGVYAVNCTASDGKAAAAHSIEIKAVTPGTVKWEFSDAGLGAINASPVIGPGGTVYAVDDINHLYAIDRNGAKKWSKTVSGRISFPPTVGADGNIYVVDDSFNAYAFAPDGTGIWGPVLQPLTEIDASPVYGPDGKIYVYDGLASALYALNPLTGVGESTFTSLVNGITNVPVRGGDGTLYIVSKDMVNDILYAVPAAGLGASTHTIVTGIAPLFPPAVGADGSVYWYASSGINSAFANGDTSKWSLSFPYTPDILDKGPVIGADGEIYVLPSGSGIYRVSAASGGLLATFTPVSPLSHLPAAGPDGAVYEVSTADLSAVKTNDSWLWGPFTAAAPALNITAAPAVARDGTVFAGDDNGKVYAFYSTAVPPAP